MRVYTGVLFMVMVFLIAGQGHVSMAGSDCERAEAVRKHVQEADNMPDRIKNELLRQADGLCPKKGNASALVQRAEDLLKQGKVSESIKHFQNALNLDPAAYCARVLKIARDYSKQGKRRVATAFFETALSCCDDEKAYKEYVALAKEAATVLEAKGSGSLIRKDVIVESLQRRTSGASYGSGSGSTYGRPSTYDMGTGQKYSATSYGVPHVIFHNILFQTGSDRLSAASYAQLDELGKALVSHALDNIRFFYVDGHTDSIGTDESNCDLAYRRASSVIRYLVERWGIHPGRLVPRSFGERRPLASNDDPSGRQLNRRVEVKNGDISVAQKSYEWGRCR